MPNFFGTSHAKHVVMFDGVLKQVQHDLIYTHAHRNSH